MPFIYSTSTNSRVYREYKKSSGGEQPQPVYNVLVKGGANRPNKNLITPHGVITRVTDEELQLLKTNRGFQKAVDLGYHVISDNKEDPDVVAADMSNRDESAPAVAQDFSRTNGGRFGKFMTKNYNEDGSESADMKVTSTQVESEE